MKFKLRTLKLLNEDVLASSLAIVSAFVVCGLLLAFIGHNPFAAYGALFQGAFGNKHKIAETLVKTVPILMMALGTSVAFKCKIWNIGGNGQYTIGAIFSIAAGLYLDLPPIILLPLTFIAAIVGGLLIGGFVGVLKAKLNANEVITTLMLDYIMLYMLSYMVNGPMMDPEGFGFPQTPILSEGLQLSTIIPGTRLHFGLVIALILLVLTLYFWRSKLGFRIRLVGEDQDVALYSGINVPRHLIITMMISASFAALAGWVEVYGLHHRLQENLAGNLGSIAIVVALLGRLNPIGIGIGALFFAALSVGGASMQRYEGVPYSLVGIIQGLVIIFVISKVVYERKKERTIG